MAQQIASDTVAKFLAKTPLLGKCALPQLVDLASGSTQDVHAAGSVILAAGEVEASLGFILQGRAAMFMGEAGAGSGRQVCRLRPGDFFSEAGFLMGVGSPLTVAALKDTMVLVVKREVMAPLMGKNPHIGLLMAKQLSDRIQQVCQAAPTQAPAPAPAAPAPTAAPLPEDMIPWVDAGTFNITPKLLEMLPSQLIRNHRLLPLELQGKILTVGMVSPRSAVALADLRRVLHSVDPKIVAISMDDFSNAFVRLKLDPGKASGLSPQDLRGSSLVYDAEKKRDDDKKGQLIIGDEVITLFDNILTEAVGYGASDIHIEPDATGVRVRYRISGNLVDREEFLTENYAGPLVARIKVLAELDIAERRLPQDGRISARMGRRELNLRISTMAVARGEKAVIRIIDPEDVMRPLHQVFLNPQLGKVVEAVTSEPYGAVVVAGPTGSGKSSTLYSLLNNRLSTRPDNNLVTVEDPVEYLLPGVTQVSVNPRVGLDFSTALFGLMRQDPDVIMIGELRDRDTANIMVEAALTGHMVLTSTHGNDAVAVLQRLRHFIDDPVILSQAISCVMVQRLTGRLCPHCVEEREVAPALMESLVARKVLRREGATKLPTPVGCSQCGRTGYMGRVAVQEVLRLDDGLRELLARSESPEALMAEAQKRSLFYSFAQAAAYLITRRVLAPSDALLITSG